MKMVTPGSYTPLHGGPGSSQDIKQRRKKPGSDGECKDRRTASLVPSFVTESNNGKISGKVVSALLFGAMMGAFLMLFLEKLLAPPPICVSFTSPDNEQRNLLLPLLTEQLADSQKQNSQELELLIKELRREHPDTAANCPDAAPCECSKKQPSPRAAAGALPAPCPPPGAPTTAKGEFGPHPVHQWSWETAGLQTMRKYVMRTIGDLKAELLEEDPDGPDHTAKFFECIGEENLNRSILQVVTLLPTYIKCFTNKRGISVVNKNQQHEDVDEAGLEWNWIMRSDARSRVPVDDSEHERPVLWQAGFSSVGTRSLAEFWKTSRPGLSVGHWEKTQLGTALVRNLIRRKPMLSGDVMSKYKVFLDVNGYQYKAHNESDSILHGCRFFTEVHAQYPQAYFILNIRDDAWGWVKSKEKHWVGVTPWAKNLWFLQWHFHYAEAWGYFSKAFDWEGESARALVFDIKHDHGNVLSQWTKEKLKATVKPEDYDGWLEEYQKKDMKKFDGDPGAGLKK